MESMSLKITANALHAACQVYPLALGGNLSDKVVRFELFERSLRTVATNGHVLGMVKAADVVDQACNTVFHLRPADVKTLAGVACKVPSNIPCEVRLVIEEDSVVHSVEFTFLSQAVTFTSVLTDYVEYEKCFPPESEWEGNGPVVIGVNTDHMMTIAKFYNSILPKPTKKNNERPRFTAMHCGPDEITPLKFSATFDSLTITAILCPIRL